MGETGGIVLILGSGPNVRRAAEWPKAWFDRVVVINNAWAVRSDWDDLIFPEDFPAARRPDAVGAGQRLIEADAFVPAQNRYGGFLFAGATMAFTAGYWALDALRPRVMAFMGCDMVYAPSGETHFYGHGAADPLRADVSLRDLEAKSARLALLAAAEGCTCVNLSQDQSRLVFPRVGAEGLAEATAPTPDRAAIEALRAEETALGYDTPDGWHDASGEAYDRAALKALDARWRECFGAT